MLEPAIADFFEERKLAWLKKKLSANSSEQETAELKQECEQLFSLDNWLPDAARRAKQLSMVTHPGKFSHPSAKTSSVIAEGLFSADGFLRNGNAAVEADVLGNAAALDVYKFLSLTLSDNKTVLEHLELESEIVRRQLAIKTNSFDQIKMGLLAIKASDKKVFTSDIVKQVYFQVDNDYHLLSILTPSGLMYELRKRIDQIRFSEENKAGREARKKQEISEQGYDDLLQLTMIGFGGTKPQNISVLNSQNGGKAYLLHSMPPELKARDVYFPRRNFFGESFRIRDCQDILSSLHGLFKLDINNMQVRERRDQRIREFIDRVVDRMWQVRMAQSQPNYYGNFKDLIAHQKVWLDSAYTQDRENQHEWLDSLVTELSRWVIRAYEKRMGKERILLGEQERLHIKQLIDANKEALR